MQPFSEQSLPLPLFEIHAASSGHQTQDFSAMREPGGSESVPAIAGMRRNPARPPAKKIVGLLHLAQRMARIAAFQFHQHHAKPPVPAGSAEENSVAPASIFGPSLHRFRPESHHVVLRAGRNGKPSSGFAQRGSGKEGIGGKKIAQGGSQRAHSDSPPRSAASKSRSNSPPSSPATFSRSFRSIRPVSSRSMIVPGSAPIR